MVSKSLSEMLGERKNKKPTPIPAEQEKQIPAEESKPTGDLNAFLFGKKRAIPAAPMVETKTEPKAEEKPVSLINTNDFTYEGQPEKIEQTVVEKLQENMEILRANIDDKGLVGASLNNILQLLMEHQFLKDNLAPEDLGDMVDALKTSHQVVLLQKATRAKAPTARQNVKLKEAENLLEGLDFGSI